MFLLRLPRSRKSLSIPCTVLNRAGAPPITLDPRAQTQALTSYRLSGITFGSVSFDYANCSIHPRYPELLTSSDATRLRDGAKKDIDGAPGAKRHRGAF